MTYIPWLTWLYLLLPEGNLTMCHGAIDPKFLMREAEDRVCIPVATPATAPTGGAIGGLRGVWPIQGLIRNFRDEIKDRIRVTRSGTVEITEE